LDTVHGMRRVGGSVGNAIFDAIHLGHRRQKPRWNWY
jgi:hypothetical protein